MALGGQQRRWIIDHEHRLLLDAIDRRDSIDAERYLAGHIRRTRIELAAHPEVFHPAPTRRRSSPVHPIPTTTG
jgi:DNA-binding GntR family transcriptional regulator